MPGSELEYWERMKKRVAIVGYSFRFPGTDPDSFWQSLRDGRDLVSQVPEDRWSQDAYLHPRKSEPGTSYTFAAGTLGDVSGFDAAFFGISPREAEQMDPQQRLLLELTWEAFERGGIRPSSVRGSRGAVYLGFSGSDYSYRRADDLASLDASTMTGNTASIAANRISYQFDLRGPSMAVDTACSSSLVAFHQAYQSIRHGESPFAVVGGVSLHLHPFAFVGFAKASMLSRRGICNVFDAAGDGYVRSEGAGVFILKELDSARADGDLIYAEVAASGVNCDGRTNGLTVPGCDTQALLLRELYAEAGIDPAEVDYLEAHGTGTAVGDPIETRALGQALGEARPKDAPLLIGSVKSNLGHLEAASGAAGLAKVLGCLEHRCVPPTIHLKAINPHIRLNEWNLQVATKNISLDPDKRLVIGVNSFGFGGANAHVILQSAELWQPEKQSAPRIQAPLLLSARSPEALREGAAAYATWLRQRPDMPLYDMAFSAAFHRDHHTYRATAFAEDREQLLTGLEVFARGGESEVIRHGMALPDASRPVFVYSGNGAQWACMGRSLLKADAVFRQGVEKVDELFQRHADFSLIESLEADEDSDRMGLTEVAQPALLAIQVGITEMLRAWGVMPAAVVGHSVGEVCAAWASGALSLEQAVAVIAARSSHQGTTRGTGGMTAVGLGEAAAVSLLEDAGLDDKLTVAGINSPRGVTLAGSIEDLQAFELRLTEQEVFQRRLKLDYAFHSPAMNPIAGPIQKDLRGLRPRASTIPFYSTVVGNRLAGEQLDAAYWWRNVREPVRFQQAINAMIVAGHNCFIEIGPNAILRNYVSDCLRDQSVEGQVIATMNRADDSLPTMRQSLFQLLISGAPLDLERLFPQRRSFVNLPTYAWQRERYWHPTTVDGYDLINRRKVHPLLGYRLHEHEAEWENQLDTELYPNLRDHAVGDAVVFPAAGFVEMALAAARAWQGGAVQELEELEIRAPLLLEDERSKTVRLRVDTGDGSFTIRSRDRLSNDPWLVNVVGRLLAATLAARPETLQLPALAADASREEHYQLTAKVGLAYGPAFQTIDRVWNEARGVLARFVTPSCIADEVAQTSLHPGYLDGGFQLLVDILRREVMAGGHYAFVPVKVGRMTLLQSGVAPAYARAEMRRRGPRSAVVSFTLFNTEGSPVASLHDVRFRAVQLRTRRVEHADFLAYQAVPRPRPSDQPVAPLPDPAVLLESARRSLHQPARMGARKAYYAEVEPLLDVLCAAFAEHALREIVGGESLIEPERLLAGGVVTGERAVLLELLIGMLEEDGVLEPTDVGWRWAPDSGLPIPRDVWISLLGDYPDYAAELLMLGRVGNRLPEMLAGQDGETLVQARVYDSAVLTHYAAGSPSVAGLQAAVRDVLKRVMDELPCGRRLRVLEWCSHRSHLTAQVLPVIDFARCDYVLAGSSQRVLDDREVLLERFPEVQTRLLSGDEPNSGTAWDDSIDLALLPVGELNAAQTEQVFDVLRRNLARDGLVVVLGEYPTRWMDLVFGPHDENGGDIDNRVVPRGPTAWQALAIRQGFKPLGRLNDVPDVDSGAFLLLLQRDELAIPAEQAGAAVASGTWVLLQDPDGYGAALANSIASELRLLGHRVVTATPSRDFALVERDHYMLDICSTEHCTALLNSVQDLHGEIYGVVHLADLNATGNERPPEVMLTAQQRRCVSAVALLRACEAELATSAVWLVTVRAALALLPEPVRQMLGSRLQDADDAPFWGLGRTAMNEFFDTRIRLVDCADPDRLERMAAGLLAEILAPDAEDEIILTSDARYAPRLRARPLPSLPDGSMDARERQIARLDFSQPGPLKHLAWRKCELPELQKDQVEIEVRAAGLNFRDVMYAMGLLSDEAVESGFAGPTLGMELSGVVCQVGTAVARVRPGDDVIAFAPASFASRAVTSSGAVVRKPAGWSFEAAATIPTTFFTVYYALHYLAKLHEGERVLIHGAAGGVGIAAIQLAKLLGAEIFATAGSEEKRDFVRMLGADHVMDSRSLAFADQIMALTGGQGVDVVLNSLAGEAINRNLRVLRPFGRFLELGKRDFYENTRVGLRPFRNNISYFGIDADQLMSERPDLTRTLFVELMALFEKGVLKPLPFRAFPAAEVVDAFRYMQQSKQIGKVVVSFRDGAPAGMETPAEPPTLVLESEATYLVTGGLGGFGLKTAQWLASKGARSLALLGRRGLATPEARAAVDALQASGIRVQVFACDVTRRKALAQVFDIIAAEMPPLRGVVHAAMVIEDGLLRNQDEEGFHKVLAPKVMGARHLHELTRDLPLDFFVLYSSATTLFGNPGQGNYVAANQYLEALAEFRRAQGLPALCVSWGAIDDVGYLARNQDVKEALQSRMGGPALQSDEALQVLEQLMLRDQTGLGVMDLEWSTLRRFLPTAFAPKFEELARHAEEHAGDVEGLAEIRRMLDELGPEELQLVFVDLLKREVANILRISPERLDENRSMYDQGMDSLMGMELVAAVEDRFGVNLPIMALSEGPTIARLVERIIRQLKAPESDAEDSGGEMGEQIRSMAARHGGEADHVAVEELTASLGDSGAENERLLNN